MRIGQGFDAHRFQEGRRLVLGGVEIPHSRGMEAHSDGDVIIHAICDALLGALALGDIGKHFPDTDARNRGIDSRIMLRNIVALLRERGYKVGNVDATVIAQAPRLAAHIQSMRQVLAEDLAVGLEAISIKATTTERMGFTGREEGIAASAIALIIPG